MSLVTSTQPAPPLNLPAQSPQAFTPATPGAALVPVATLNAKHGYHQLFSSTWEDLDVLYQGGRVLQMQADRFLIKKPHEMPDVYATRLQRFTYHNLLGLAIGFYLSKLFEENPEIDIKENGVTLSDPNEEAAKNAAAPPDGTAKVPDKKTDPEVWDFYIDNFLKDCDGAKQTYVDFMRDAMRQALLFRRCFVLIDLPPEVQKAQNAGEQNMRPMLRLYDPRQALNWDSDAAGNLKWIVFRVETTQHQFLQADVVVRRWYYFDRLEFMVYEWRSDNPTRGTTDGTDTAALIDQGPHSMADYVDPDSTQLGRVPVYTFELPDGMWLAHRVFLPVIDHLNTDNSLGWALFNANLAVPVITGPAEYQPTLTEVGYIYIREGTFSWAEPSGTSFDHSQKRIENLREEIFRLMYLQAQGRSSKASASAQSGYSKELDMAPAGDALKFLGDSTRAAMQIILELVAAIRQEKALTFDVRGFDFDDEEVLPEIEATAGAQALSIRSETFAREIEKQLIRRYGKDWNPELLMLCCKEIDDAPSKAELDEQQQQQEQDQIKNSMQSAALKLTIQNGPGKAMFPQPVKDQPGGGQGGKPGAKPAPGGKTPPPKKGK